MPKIEKHRGLDTFLGRKTFFFLFGQFFLENKVGRQRKHKKGAKFEENSALGLIGYKTVIKTFCKLHNDEENPRPNLFIQF